MKGTARLFNCARCQSQVIVCSDCDRGNIYCKSCSTLARVQSIQRASQKYQNTLQGKLNHAARQKRYRNRLQQKVTHQGSPSLTPDVVLGLGFNEQHQQGKQSVIDAVCCHFCQKACSGFLRIDFLQNYFRKKQKDLFNDKGGSSDDYFDRTGRQDFTLLSCGKVANRDDRPPTECAS